MDHRGAHYRASEVCFLPRPVQRPRVPVWIGGRFPARRPLERGAKWDGYFPMDLAGPQDMAACAAAIRELRGHLGGFDLVAHGAPGSDPRPWFEAGATWWLASVGIEDGPEAVLAIAATRPD